MDKQAREARKMAKELPFGKKLPYIWMYYKYWILGISFLITLIAVSAYQIANRPEYDLEICYYAENGIADETVAALEEYFAGYVEDVTGDGISLVKVYVNAENLIGMGDEASYMIQTKLLAELAAAEYSAFLFDGAYYEMVQRGTYEGSMESLRSIESVPELKELIPLPEGSHLYWGTRALYETEMDKPEKVSLYHRVAEVEHAVFGER